MKINDESTIDMTVEDAVTLIRGQKGTDGSFSLKELVPMR